MTNPNQGGQGFNRTLIIPQGTLNSDEVNVVYIPPSLHNTTHPLIVRPAQGNRKTLRAHSLPIWDDELSRRDNGCPAYMGQACGADADLSEISYSGAGGKSGYDADISNLDNTIEYDSICGGSSKANANITHMSSSTISRTTGTPAEHHEIVIDAPGGMDENLLERVVNRTKAGDSRNSSRRSAAPANATYNAPAAYNMPDAAGRSPQANATFVRPPDGNCGCNPNNDDFDSFDPGFTSSFRYETPPYIQYPSEHFPDSAVPSSWEVPNSGGSHIDGSGSLDTSVLGRVFGGEFNVIEPMTPSPRRPVCPPCSGGRAQSCPPSCPNADQPNATRAQHDNETFGLPANATYAPGNVSYRPEGNATYPPAVNIRRAQPANATYAGTANATYAPSGNAPLREIDQCSCQPAGNATYPPAVNVRHAQPANATYAGTANATYAPSGNAPLREINQCSCRPAGNATYPPAVNVRHAQPANATYAGTANASCVQANATYAQPANATYGQPANATYGQPANATYAQSAYLPSGNATYPPTATARYAQPANATYERGPDSTYEQRPDSICAQGANAICAQSPAAAGAYDSFEPNYFSSLRQYNDYDSFDQSLIDTSDSMPDSLVAGIFRGDHNVISPMTPSPTKPPCQPCAGPNQGQSRSQGNTTNARPRPNTTYPPRNACGGRQQRTF